MAISVPSLNDITASWVTGAAQGATNYRKGVSNSAVDWEGPTADAQDNWKQGVSLAAAGNSFENGVRRAGNTKWRNRSVELGAQRFSQGVAAATDEFRSGFEPYLDILRNINLPPRGPRGSAANIARVTAVTEPLHQERLRIQGSS